ncbi:hypothetical protein COS81_03320 [candidate division WWE3 bacterium CG06_land_8_20_14_3_00_42_16]|uniref:DhaL domain-containing protein n=4 Tax=Katanobacteria TaxID=422282 RepID=A0A2M7AMN1_UNCKA|nr:MAG: hypothetical protein COS81_03320 [candidate division WWE3 bacterium CG06_land_8_20_14_3_00_42_16]PIZ43856.1 MAG: hypothetical protein COY34_00195 [candidate division WWE3 bacterium CG_4_10_14_0_2_um_filter_42_8]PJA37625.1 MAG: hypothetical protein CO181_02735 [candidate division WWE3 bacterium CG_4_9_14_3_um_filter_43_9]PJC67985.1 MAG: hypothetical protein CO015_05635 [candidate division WWE3 bacterium CG_4_8_14_3_um_filter_42_11]
MKPQNYSLNIVDIQKAFAFAEILYKKNEELINDLNVFPVPDGDTGSNMLATIQAVNLKLKREQPKNFNHLSNLISQEALMGARGNSGVILSQFLNGFFDVFKKSNDITNQLLVKALTAGKDEAFRCVAEPKEGTILTIIRNTAEEFKNQINKGIHLQEAFRKTYNVALKSLKNTPNLLPVLKEAGVVDAGAVGFVLLLESIKQALLLKNESFQTNDFLENFETDLSYRNISNFSKDVKLRKLFFLLKLNISYQILKKTVIFFSSPFLGLARLFVKAGRKQLKKFSPNLFKKPYHKHCFEILIKSCGFNKITLEKALKMYGDSLIIGGGEPLLKVHLHTNKPREVLAFLNRNSEVVHKRLSDLEKKQDLFLRQEANTIDNKPVLVAVSQGEGFKKLLEDFNVKIIDGGKTMNPSVETILNFVENLPQNEIIFFPNNKNIFLTAQGASKICLKNIYLVYSESIPQTLSSLINFNPERSVCENASSLNQTLSRSKLVRISQAVRDTRNQKKIVKSGDFIAMDDDSIIFSGDDLSRVTVSAVTNVLKNDTQLITIYTGNNASTDEIDKLKSALNSHFPHLEQQFYDGGQPYSFYLILLET